jgi:DNA-binding CsgD family transcriptional regulator
VGVLRANGFEYELKLFLPAPSGMARTFDFMRGAGCDFDERDRSVLALLRPHLVELRRRWERRSRPAVLTAREREVVLLVAEGRTNSEIAERLVISTSTVRTHLEHAYEKLGVHTRTAAVAAAFRLTA